MARYQPPINPESVLGELLRDIREDREIKQETLARILGKAQTFVSKTELAERKLGLVEFCEIVEALGGEPSEVLGQFLTELDERERSHAADETRNVTQL